MTKTYQKFRPRVAFISLLVILSWIGLSSRLFQVMILDKDDYRKRSAQNTTKNQELIPLRGNIFDRNNIALTRNVIHYNLGAHPYLIKDKDLLSKKLSQSIGNDFDYYKSKLMSKKKYETLHIKIKKEKIESLLKNTPKGIKIDRYTRRVYPHSNIAGQIVGFSDSDDKGLTGIENEFNKELSGAPGWEVKKVDSKGRSHYNNNFPKKESLNGSNIQLAIDIEFQIILVEELKRRINEMNAAGGIGIIANPQNGKILAMTSMPDFDPNQHNNFPVENQKNRAIADQFEPGSIFKIVASTAAINNKIVNLEDEFFCEDGEYEFAGNVISDYKSFGLMSFSDIFANSSNIGMVKIAKKLGPRPLYEYSRNYGFGSLTGIPFPGETKGILRNIEQWSERSIIGVSIGYEVGVTALQMVMAYSAIANGGYLLKPILIDQIISPSGEIEYASKTQVIRKIATNDTMDKMRKMLSDAVLFGTGKKAYLKGWSVAGKTGTAYKLINGEYSKKFISNFIGFFPNENPQIVCLIIIDDPKPKNGMHTGGDVAAPAFKRISQRIINFDDTIQMHKPTEKNKIVNAKNKNVLLSSVNFSQKYKDGYSVMPNVKGMSLLKAKKTLIAANIIPTIKGSGTVVWQTPSPGSKINPGSNCALGLK